METLQRLTHICHICPQPSPAAIGPVNLSWQICLCQNFDFVCLSMSFSIPFSFPPSFFHFPILLWFSMVFPPFVSFWLISFLIFLCLSLPAFSLARLHFGSETRSSGAAASGVHRVQELGREAELGQPEVAEVAEVIELGVDRVEERRERRERRERSKNSRSFRRSLGASLTLGRLGSTKH